MFSISRKCFPKVHFGCSFLVSTFDTFVSSLALRAELCSFSSFIFIAWPTHWKATLFASQKQVSISHFANLVSTYLTNLTIQTFPRLWLQQFKELQHIIPTLTKKEIVRPKSFNYLVKTRK